jgi:hypothetical protein
MCSQWFLPLLATLAACASGVTLRSASVNRRAPREQGAVTAHVPLALDPSTRSTGSSPCGASAWSATLDGLLGEAPESARGAFSPPRPWDRVVVPRYLERVERRFMLTPDEREVLARNGFVVPDRLEVPGYAHAYHLVHEAELPVYISSDSMLFALGATHAPFVAHVEESTLAPMLGRVLDRMHAELATRAASLPAEVAADVDLLLTVARSLLERDEGTVAPALGPQRAIEDMVTAARAATRRSERFLFGRARVMDFTAYEPRGHHLRSRALMRYFRASVWLSRVEFNILSRGCRSSHPGPSPDARETPREALAALALVDLAERAGVMEPIARIDQALSILQGRREDLSMAELATMRTIVRVSDLRAPDAFERIASIARNQPRRILTVHQVPEGVSDLPVVFSFLGGRVRPGDSLPASLVAPALPRRMFPTAAEAAYALGFDRARAWLDAPLGEHPELIDAMPRVRTALRDTVGGNDLLSNWFRALEGLALSAPGRRPGFMHTDAFADLRLNTVIAAYGQYLRRDEPRTDRPRVSLGCRIPTGWVDPTPETYGAIGMYAERALALARAAAAWREPSSTELQARDAAFFRAFDTLSRTARALTRFAEDELAGRVPGDAQVSFLASVAELAEGASESDARFEGWYFHLFPSVDMALERADFAAEWGAAANAPARTWIGSAVPRIGFFVVDNGGHPFIAAGPVARAWELTAPPGTRHDRVLSRGLSEGLSPWSASWLVAQGPEPPLAITETDPSNTVQREFVVRAGDELGTVTLELLDVHGSVLGAHARTVGRRAVRFVFPRPPARPTDAGSGTRRRPRYIDNTRNRWMPHTLRVRTEGYWLERPLHNTEPLRIVLGAMSPIDASGEFLTPRRKR